ncbi:hypothetical protein NL676_014817 [Syzygium grande]|nr:hypothetical protein NL676_014817 [Syzygium grande]
MGTDPRVRVEPIPSPILYDGHIIGNEGVQARPDPTLRGLVRKGGSARTRSRHLSFDFTGRKSETPLPSFLPSFRRVSAEQASPDRFDGKSPRG